MSDWKEFSLGEVADPKDRYSFSGGPFGSNLKSEEYTENGIRIIQLQNIGDGTFKDEYKIYTSNEKADELFSCNIYPGDIVLSKMGDPVARATLIPDTHDRYLMASDGIRLKVDPTRFDSTFVLNAINSPQFRSTAEGVSGGSTRKRIGLTTLKGLTIYAPPLPEQKKIAEILSGIDNTIQHLLKAISLHERARNALMESIFQDGYQTAKSGSDEWQTWTIEELLANTPTPMRSGPFGSALLKEELAEAGIPFLGIDNVKTEEFVPSFKRFLGNSKFNELRRYEVFPHDVMITIMGTVGRSCVVPEGIGQCVSSKHTWTMTFDRKKVSPEIICWQLNHFSRTRKKFLESSQGGVMDAISSQTLRKIEVPIPANKEYAKKLAEQYLSSRRYQQALKAKLAKIRLLKRAVTSNLLSGRKRVTL